MDKRVLLTIFAILIIVLASFSVYNTNLFNIKNNLNSYLQYMNIIPHFQYQKYNSSDSKVQDFVFKDTVTFEYPKGWTIATAGSKSGYFKEGVAPVIGVGSDYKIGYHPTSVSLAVIHKPFNTSGDKIKIGDKDAYCDGIIYYYPDHPGGETFFSKTCELSLPNIPDYYFSVEVNGAEGEERKAQEVLSKIIETFQIREK